MSDSTAAPSTEEGGATNGLPPELRQVGESSGKLTARIETLAKELTESEARAREAEMSLARAQLRIDAMAATIARQAESLRLQDAVRDAEQASHQALIDAAAHAVIQLEAEVARLKNGAPAKLGIDP